MNFFPHLSAGSRTLRNCAYAPAIRTGKLCKIKEKNSKNREKDASIRGETLQKLAWMPKKYYND
jgi:hypothetical protein